MHVKLLAWPGAGTRLCVLAAVGVHLVPDALPVSVPLMWPQQPPPLGLHPLAPRTPGPQPQAPRDHRLGFSESQH